MNAVARVRPPRELARAVEALQQPLAALRASAAGIAAGLAADTLGADGVCFLLEAVADQLEGKIEQIERAAAA